MRRFINIMRLLSLFLGLSSLTFASELRLTALHLPLYFHSDMDTKALSQSIPFVTAYASPEASLAAMSQPFIPHHDKSWKEAADTNLITIYGLHLTFAQMDGSTDYLMAIDASKAKRPEGMPFTIAEVVEETKKCATLNFPSYNGSKIQFEVTGLPTAEPDENQTDK